ncbi:MAG: tautomerase family protein [Campylobacterales bacterium]|nr:tautomerase family protein [Campylobacterales bacterium]
MPIINIKVAGKLTMEQKRELSKRVSTAMEEVCSKPKESCYIVFDEIDRANFAKGEVILSDADAKLQK